MKFILSSLLLLALLNSCSRETIAPTPPSAEDSMGAGWRKIPVSNGKGFLDMGFRGNTGFGISGTDVFKSTDGGESWESITRLMGSYINFSMGDSNTLAMVGSGKENVLTSSNRGVDFAYYSVDDIMLNDAFFVDGHTGYLIGNSLWKTTDSSKTWKKLYQFTNETGYPSSYKTLFFLDTLRGWVISGTSQGVPALFRTENGGLSWEMPDSSALRYKTCAIFFVNEDIGYMNTRKNEFYKTTDGGNSWELKRKDIIDKEFYPGIYFIDENLGYFSNYKKIYKTTDGGQTFSTEVALSKDNETAFFGIQFNGPNVGWAWGVGEFILKYQR